MAIDYGVHGYDYTRDLCSAIESLTAEAEKRRPGAYIYQGMQLRHAVERWLYIQCINSPALFQNYLAQNGVEDISKGKLPALTPLEARMAAFLPGAQGLAEGGGQTVRTMLCQTARRAYGWLRSSFTWRQTTLPNANTGARILIHIVNAKFARYLAPVTRRLGGAAYAYLAACDADLGHKLRQAEQPVVYWPLTGASLKSIFRSAALSEFELLVHEAEATYAALRALRPNCVVVVEGNAPLDVITAEASRLLGIPCFCIQQGWSPVVHSGFRHMAFTEMLVWGDEFVRLLGPHNPEQKFRVTGSHAMPAFSPAVRDPASAKMTFGFFLQAPCALLGLAAYNEFVDLIDDLAVAHPQIRLLVREHPGYPLPEAAKGRLGVRVNIRFSDPVSERLPEAIQASDMVVSVFSTVLLEALALNVVPLICSTGSMRHYAPDLAALGVAIEVDTIAGARQVLEDVIHNPARLAQMRARLPNVVPKFFKEGDAAGLIAQHLLEVIELPVSGR
jgi:hypothetical protein